RRLVRALEEDWRDGTRCEYIPVRSPRPSMASDGPVPPISLQGQKVRCRIRVKPRFGVTVSLLYILFWISLNPAHCSLPAVWRRVAGPCAAGMPRASVQGRIYSV